MIILNVSSYDEYMDVHKAIIKEKTGIFEENNLNKLIFLLNELNIEDNDKINENKIIEDIDIDNSNNEDVEVSLS